MGRSPDGPAQLASFIESSALEVHDIFDREALEAAVALIARYADTPMDFADATLVVLAERLHCPEILTLDERGFRTFRYGKKRRFHLVLQD
jgi:predicted nucleic acid-binding protein